jgi:hypothetical protein
MATDTKEAPATAGREWARAGRGPRGCPGPSLPVRQDESDPDRIERLRLELSKPLGQGAVQLRPASVELSYEGPRSAPSH